MRVLFDQDPLTGVSQFFSYDEDKDRVTIETRQDVSGFLDALRAKRNDPDKWKEGVKESWAHFCSIPAVVEMELKAKGIDIYDPTCTKRLIAEINQNYPYLKATDKNG